MTQAELERAVARATGENVATIRGRGFQLAEVDPEEPDDPDAAPLPTDDGGPRVFDWDGYVDVALADLWAAA